MVPGSIPGGVTGFFSDIFPSDLTMAMGSTQALVKMSTRNIPGGYNRHREFKSLLGVKIAHW
jgi:hypothetical protein